ncbi:hypothetical protein NPIL_510621, partial [Nephila pilipes]
AADAWQRRQWPLPAGRQQRVLPLLVPVPFLAIKGGEVSLIGFSCAGVVCLKEKNQVPVPWAAKMATAALSGGEVAAFSQMRCVYFSSNGNTTAFGTALACLCRMIQNQEFLDAQIQVAFILLVPKWFNLQMNASGEENLWNSGSDLKYQKFLFPRL